MGVHRERPFITINLFTKDIKMTKLTEILKKALDNESDIIKSAKKDLKKMKQGLFGVKRLRSVLAEEISFCKKQIFKADHFGGGPKSSRLRLELQMMREALNELTQEQSMIKMNLHNCYSFIEQKQKEISDIDSEWEKSKQ